MVFKYVEYNALAESINASIITEIESHGFVLSEDIKKEDIKKGIDVFAETNPLRAKQCEYLLAILECLELSKEADKTKILNAAAYYIREQIFISYKRYSISWISMFFPKPEGSTLNKGSTLYNGLTNSLNLTRTNFPDAADLKEMYTVLDHFMRACVEQENKPLSEETIQDFVNTLLNDLVEILSKLARQIPFVDEQNDSFYPSDCM